jgi:hypothetical protein
MFCISLRRGESKSFPLKMQGHGAFSSYAILRHHVPWKDWVFTASNHCVANRACCRDRWVPVEDHPIPSRA